LLYVDNWLIDEKALPEDSAFAAGFSLLPAVL
jgi:hypothetical protein